jgi:cytochrome c553
MRKILLYFFVICISCVALAALASAQTQSSVTDLQKLQAQKDRAQLEADIAKAEEGKAEAEAAAFKARLGSMSTANLPQGTVKTDNVVIEGSYLAYMAASSAAQVIASRVPCGANLVFFSAKDLDGIQALDALKAQIPLISGGKADLVKPLELERVSAFVLPVPLGEVSRLYSFKAPLRPEFPPAAIFAGIDAGLSVLSLFKTDTEFHGVTVTGDDLALQALVAQQLASVCASNHATAGKVIHPLYSYPRLETDPSKNQLIKSLQDLSGDLTEVSLMYQNLTERVQMPLGKAVEGLRKLIADHRDTRQLIPILEVKLKAATTQEERKKIQAELDTTRKHLTELDETARVQYDPTENLPAQGKAYSDKELAPFLEPYLTDQLRVDIRVQALKALQTKMSEFVAALTKPDSNGVTPLVGLLRAQALRDAQGAGAKLLQVGFVTAGGNNIIKRNIFHSSLWFSGGVVAKYFLADDAGYIVASGVVACYGGQVKEGDIGKAFTKQKGATACTEEIPKRSNPEP